MELVDITDLKSVAVWRAGSIPAAGTKSNKLIRINYGY